MSAQDWRFWFGVLALFLFMLFGASRQMWRDAFDEAPFLRDALKPYIGEWLDGRGWLAAKDRQGVHGLCNLARGDVVLLSCFADPDLKR